MTHWRDVKRRGSQARARRERGTLGRTVVVSVAAHVVIGVLLPSLEPAPPKTPRVTAPIVVDLVQRPTPSALRAKALPPMKRRTVETVVTRVARRMARPTIRRTIRRSVRRAVRRARARHVARRSALPLLARPARPALELTKSARGRGAAPTNHARPSALAGASRPATRARPETRATSAARAAGSGPSSEPVPLARVRPAYPEPLRELGLEGNVVLQLSISRVGAVVRARVTRRLHPQLDRLALAAAHRMRFRPAFRRGSAVSADVRYTFAFVLD